MQKRSLFLALAAGASDLGLRCPGRPRGWQRPASHDVGYADSPRVASPRSRCKRDRNVLKLLV